MLIRMAWRNIWRNRKRTLITVAALALGTSAIVFTHSWAESMYSTMIDLATRGVFGHMQVVAPGFHDDPDIFTVLEAPDRVAAAVREVLPQSESVQRVTGFGLAGVGQRSAGVMVVGIEPARERRVTELVTVVDGRGLSDQAQGEAVLGASLAKRLKASPGSELVLLGQAADGSLANDLYTVVGTVRTSNNELSNNAVFLHLRDAQGFFALGDEVHQLLITLTDGSEPKQRAAELRASLLQGPDPRLDPEAVEIKSWNEIMPEVEAAIAADRQATYALDVIVFMIVVLGIFNTMTMATFERVTELGIMRSLGTTRSGVLGLIVTESLMIGLVSLVLGTLLGMLVVTATGTIDISAFGEGDFMGVAIPTVITVTVQPLAPLMAAVTVMATCFVGALWPAWRASRMNPASAVRYV